MHRDSTEGESGEDWRETLLMNAGNTSDQPPEPSIQLQTLPGRIPKGEGDSLQRNVGDGTLQEEWQPDTAAVQDTSTAQESPGVDQRESWSRPKRLRRQPAYLNDFVL